MPTEEPPTIDDQLPDVPETEPNPGKQGFQDSHPHSFFPELYQREEAKCCQEAMLFNDIWNMLDNLKIKLFLC